MALETRSHDNPRELIDHFLATLYVWSHAVFEYYSRMAVKNVSPFLPAPCFFNQAACGLCGKEFVGEWNGTRWIGDDNVSEDERRVRDHCHRTGTFRTIAHASCNLKRTYYKKPYALPTYAHNR